MTAQQGADVVGACDIGSLERLKRENPDGLFVMVKQDGCSACEEMDKVISESVQARKPVIDANISQDPACRTLADQLKVGHTPTVFFFKQGQEPVRLEPDGTKTWDMMRKELRGLADR